MPANLENSAVATGLEKVSFHSNPKKGIAKECSNYRTIALISHASKVMLKILQARLQQYVKHELPDVQASFRDTKGTFHAKMGSIKDRNGMDLTEAEISRRGVKNTQKNYTKKIFRTQITTMV